MAVECRGGLLPEGCSKQPSPVSLWLGPCMQTLALAPPCCACLPQHRLGASWERIPGNNFMRGVAVLPVRGCWLLTVSNGSLNGAQAQCISHWAKLEHRID